MSNNPYTILGQGKWECIKKRGGKSTICKAVCWDGRNAINGNTKARCDIARGKWITNRPTTANCRPEDAGKRGKKGPAKWIY